MKVQDDIEDYEEDDAKRERRQVRRVAEQFGQLKREDKKKKNN